MGQIQYRTAFGNRGGYGRTGPGGLSMHFANIYFPQHYRVGRI
jgi:hypothetical protein